MTTSDPIFELIEQHKREWEAYYQAADGHALDNLPEGEREAEVRRLGHRYADCACALVRAVPQTLAGLKAKVEHISACEAQDEGAFMELILDVQEGEPDESYETKTPRILLKSITDALRNIECRGQS
jgi:hypothetical protein